MNYLDYLLPPPGFPMPDQFIAPVWLLTTILLIVSAWRSSRMLFPSDGYLETIGHTILICWATIVLFATILGALGVLSGPILLGCAGLVAGVLLFQCRSTPFRPSPADPLIVWGSLPHLLGTLFAFDSYVIRNGLAIPK